MEQHLSSQENSIEECKEFLRSSGDENEHLQSALPENPDFEEGYDISNPGSRGRLNEIPDDEPKTNILHENPFYYVANTKGAPPTPEKNWEDGRKGHEVRYMSVWKKQGDLPPVSETYYKGPNMTESMNLAEILRDITFEEVGDGYVVVGGSMQEFEDHLHFIASDLKTKPPAESDLPGLNNWFLYRVENGEAAELEEHKSREKIGDYLKELLL
jgi:hypothetical protein